MDEYLARLSAGGAQANLIGEALLVEKSESGGALIYWDGNYKWQQHGD